MKKRPVPGESKAMRVPVVNPPRKAWVAAALLPAAILLLAALLRFAGLETMPPGLCLDESMNGVNVMEALETGSWRVFYPDNHTANAQVVKIKSGDTIGKLARKYGTSVKEICAMNKIKPSTKLRIGRTIRVR